MQNRRKKLEGSHQIVLQHVVTGIGPPVEAFMTSHPKYIRINIDLIPTLQP